jgi:hypothetical protein
MMTRWFKLGSAFSLMLTSTLMTACGSSDMYDPDATQEDGMEEGAEDAELGSLEQAMHNCSNPDGTNAVMAALAVAVGHELGRWNSALDFESTGSVIRLTSGTGSDGKPRGKSRCSGGVCPRIEGLLSLQNSNATNVYLQAETSTALTLVHPGALSSRMVAKFWEQQNIDRDARDGDLNQPPKTAHTLIGAGMTTALGGCGPHYKFNVAFAATTTTPKPLPAQLRRKLGFADEQNGWVDFRDLGNNVVAVDPTYGLNDEDTTSTGSCTAACTKVSTTNIAGACCSCGGVNKKFVRSAFSTSVYLCQ